MLLKELGLQDVDLLSNPQTISNQKDSISAQNDGYDFDLFLNQANATTSLERDLMSANAYLERLTIYILSLVSLRNSPKNPCSSIHNLKNGLLKILNIYCLIVIKLSV